MISNTAEREEPISEKWFQICGSQSVEAAYVYEKRYQSGSALEISQGRPPPVYTWH